MRKVFILLLVVFLWSWNLKAQCTLPPAIITPSGNAFFCGGSSLTLTANTGPGLSYQWFAGFAAIPGATASTYVAVMASSYRVDVSNACGTTSSSYTTVSNLYPPGTPQIAATGQTLCNGIPVTMTTSTANGLSFQWKLNGSSIAGATNSSYTTNAGGSFSVTVSNGCGTATSSAFVIPEPGIPATPGPISGQDIGVCQSSKVYTINAVSSAGYYQWTVPANATLAGGQGTTGISVSFPSGFSSGSISVIAMSTCGSSSPSAITVYGLPPAPGPITGPVSVCHRQNNVTYSISAVSSATSYSWTVPQGTQIKSGQGTRTIKVRFGNSPGLVTVKAVNSCGMSGTSTLSISMPCRENYINEDLLPFEVNVYPNPSSSVFRFVFQSENEMHARVQISDLCGRIVKDMQAVSGQELTFGEDISRGVYLMRVEAESQMRFIKLIKDN